MSLCNAIHRFAVDSDVLESHASNVLNEISVFDTGKIAIDERDVLNWCGLKPAQVEGVLCLLRLQILDRDVAANRLVISIAAFFIVEIDVKGSYSNFADCQVTSINVFNDSAAQRVVFDPYRGVEMRAVEPAVF